MYLHYKYLFQPLESSRGGAVPPLFPVFVALPTGSVTSVGPVITVGAVACLLF